MKKDIRAHVDCICDVNGYLHFFNLYRDHIRFSRRGLITLIPQNYYLSNKEIFARVTSII